MNKLLRYSMLWMLALIRAATNAVVIDFTQLSIAETTTGFTLDVTIDGYGYSFVAEKNDGTTAPTQNAKSKDIRLYAQNSLTVSGEGMTKMVFKMSDQGLKQWGTVTADKGTVTVDVTAGTTTWVSTEAVSSVTFTVGTSNDYGTNTSKTAGQFDFIS